MGVVRVSQPPTMKQMPLLSQSHKVGEITADGEGVPRGSASVASATAASEDGDEKSFVGNMNLSCAIGFVKVKVRHWGYQAQRSTEVAEKRKSPEFPHWILWGAWHRERVSSKSTLPLRLVVDGREEMSHDTRSRQEREEDIKLRQLHCIPLVSLFYLPTQPPKVHGGNRDVLNHILENGSRGMEFPSCTQTNLGHISGKHMLYGKRKLLYSVH
ncbi:hypothetical protein EDC04DRAFT_3091813 [Pisolithus marmoratus]|nr:hypothetical protein EDC04DRAFT_3091813 [Pisolithus marmoratus]